MKNKIVENFCGPYPEGHVFQDISSNPNYVFKNDSNYDQVMLSDIEGNTVYVNSFIECEHYVLGGWNYSSPKSFGEGLDLLMFSKLLIVVLIVTTIIKIIGKLKEQIV